MFLSPVQLLSFLCFLFLFVSAQINTIAIGQDNSDVQYSAGWRTAMHNGQPFRLVDFLEADVQIALPSKSSQSFRILANPMNI